eukprot:6972369-Prymnesium_polylepis.1
MTFVPAYSAMKPSGGATPFPASSTHRSVGATARGYSRVQGGGECDGLGGQKTNFTVGPLVDCEGRVHSNGVRMDSAPSAIDSARSS